MKNGVLIYEDGVLQEMHESENFFVFVKKDEGGRYYKFIKNDTANTRAFFDLRLRATEDLKEELTAEFGDEFFEHRDGDLDMTNEELHYLYLNAIKPDRIVHEISHLEEEKARIQKDLVRRFIYFGQAFHLDPETFVNKFTNASTTQRDMEMLKQIDKDLEFLYMRLANNH